LTPAFRTAMSLFIIVKKGPVSAKLLPPASGFLVAETVMETLILKGFFDCE